MLEVVAGIIERGTDILLCQRHHNSLRFPLKWEFPGGKVEPKESPHDAIVRELNEELGIEVLHTELLYDYTFAYPDEKAIHLYFFLIKTYEKNLEDLQFETIKWVQKTKLPQYDILKGDLPFLDLYLKSR